MISRPGHPGPAAAVRDSRGCTDRIRPSDITDGGGLFASPRTTGAAAEDALPYGRLGRLPVVGEHGSAPGVLALSRFSPSPSVPFSL